MASVANGILTLDSGEGSVSNGVLTLAAGVGSVSGGVLTLSALRPPTIRITNRSRTGIRYNFTMTWDPIPGATAYEYQLLRRDGSHPITSAELVALAAQSVVSTTSTSVNEQASSRSSSLSSRVKVLIRIRTVRGMQRSVWSNAIQTVNPGT